MCVSANNLFNSSSFRTANWISRPWIRVLLRSREEFPASSRISAVKYSMTAACVQTICVVTFLLFSKKKNTNKQTNQVNRCTTSDPVCIFSLFQFFSNSSHGKHQPCTWRTGYLGARCHVPSSSGWVFRDAFWLINCCSQFCFHDLSILWHCGSAQTR